VTELGYTPGFRIPRHHHVDPQVCFVLDGLLTEVLDRGVLECRRFDLSFKPARASHCVESGPAGARVMVVEIRRERLRASTALAEALSAPIQLARGSLDGLGLGIHAELRSDDRFSRLAIEGGILEFLATAIRRLRPPGPGDPYPWLEQVTTMLEDGLSERVTVTDLARAVGVGERQLTRVFRSRHGCEIDAYLRKRRVRKAAHHLTSSNEPLVQIALGCGFFDQSHFTRVFKQHTGLTPAAYRRRNRLCPRGESESN
jgi:AraC family transcriptional regulator